MTTPAANSNVILNAGKDWSDTPDNAWSVRPIPALRSGQALRKLRMTAATWLLANNRSAYEAHRDPGLLLVLLVATAARLAFALRPPPFLTIDSQGYFLPGWELAHGLGFGPELRRTPTYPLFIGLVVFLLGDDLRGLTLAQHGLGVLTAGLTYTLGRRAFGRLAVLMALLALRRPTRGRLLAAGLALAAASLTRPVAEVLLPLLPLVLLAHHRAWRPALR